MKPELLVGKRQCPAAALVVLRELLAGVYFFERLRRRDLERLMAALMM